MEFHGNISLLQNYLQQASLEIEDSFPSVPVVGRVVFKDKRVYICVEITTGIPIWVPLTNEIASYAFSHSPGDLLWTVVHNMNTMTPSVQIYGMDNKMIIPDSITIIDNNTLTVSFGVSTAGRGVVLTGNIEGATRPNYAFEWTQTNPSTTWTIIHNIGHFPITRVFIGNQEVQPASIIHDTVNQTTISFTTPQVGVARFL